MNESHPLSMPLTGRRLIEASAGTGKTHALTTLYLRVLLETPHSVEKVLVVTFTEAAARELHQRIRQRVAAAISWFADGTRDGEEELAGWLRRRNKPAEDLSRLRQAAASLDDAKVSTIHAFCRRILSDFAFECGLPFQPGQIGGSTGWEHRLVQDFLERELEEADETLLQAYFRSGDLLSDELGKGSRKGDPLFEHLLRWLRWADGGRLVLHPRSSDLRGAAGAMLARETAWQTFAKLWQEKQPNLQQVVDEALDRRIFQRHKLLALVQTCADLLQSHGQCPDPLPKRLDLLSWKNRCQRAKRHSSPLAHPLFHAVDELLDRDFDYRQEQKRQLVALAERFTIYAEREGMARKKRENHLEFGDLLSWSLEALERHPSLPAQLARDLPVALIDEFQDTDPLQYAIFDRIYGRGSATCSIFIGDPKQAIYSFRNADLETYLAARETCQGSPLRLSTNRRSDPALLEALNHLYLRRQTPFLRPEIAYDPVQPPSGASNRLHFDNRPCAPLQFLQLSSARVEEARQNLADATASRIVDLLSGPWRIGERGVRPLDLAVLVRSAQQGRTMQRALRRLGVPSLFHSSQDSLFQSDCAEDLLRVLTAIAQPHKEPAIRLALLTDICGLDLRGLEECSADESRWMEVRNLFFEAHELLRKTSLPRMWARFSAHFQPELGWSERAEGARKMTNLHHLLDLLTEAAYQQNLGADSLVAWLKQAIRSESDAELRLESEADAVTISTIHRAKGLEWPIVFCPFLLMGTRMDGGRYHDPSQPGKRIYALILDADSRSRMEEEALQEDARLLYVALTRARHLLTVGLPLLENPARSGLFHLLFDLCNHRGKDTDTHALYQELKSELAIHAGKEERPLFSFTENPALKGPPWHGRPMTPLVEPRRLAGAVDRRFRIGSYSGLLLRAPLMEREQDRNDPGLPDDPSEGGGERGALVGEILLRDFPKGPRAGEAIHSILEHGSFPQGFKAEELGRSLERFGIEPAWTDSLLQALEAVLDFPLPFGCLRDVVEEHRLNEMEFLLPLLDREALSAGRLAAAFRHHPSPKIPARYIEDLAHLNFPSLRGFFKGFIDLVFRHQNRYYLVDYKSNFLGPTWADYEQQRLSQAMAHHHYFLQYHLYVVALVRHLRALLPDFEYSRDFGGVYYLFLRGMARGGGPCGVFADTPPPGLIGALDALFVREAGRE